MYFASFIQVWDLFFLNADFDKDFAQLAFNKLLLAFNKWVHSLQ